MHKSFSNLLKKICCQAYLHQVKYQYNIGWSECCWLHTTHQHNSAEKTTFKSRDKIMATIFVYIHSSASEYKYTHMFSVAI